MPRGNKGIEGISLDIGNTIDPAAAAANGTSADTGNGGTVRDSAGNEFDPERHSHPDTRNADGTFRRKKGRKAGSTNKSKAHIHSDIKASAEMLTKGLLVFHTTLAAMTNTPELILDEAEASGLSESGLTLMSLYDIKPDPKVEAALLFAGNIGLVYGSRIFAIRARKAQEAAEKKPGVAGVYDENGNAAGTTTYATDTAPRVEWPFVAQPN